MAMKVTYTVINGEVLSENRNGVIRDYVPDSLGSTIALLDNTQSITDTFEYWPYGEVRSRTGTTATPFQFVGTLGYYTDASGRAYVRARYLRMDATRWLTEDPIGLTIVDLNIYRYVGSHPLRFVDPTGLQAAKAPKRGAPQVYVCDSISVPFTPLHHSYISTNKCGAKEYNNGSGLFPIGKGIVRNVDDKLVGVPGFPGYYVPGQPVCKGWPFCFGSDACHLVSSDPRFEDAVCECASRPPFPFFNPLYNCQSWVGDVLGCGCKAISAGDNWFLGKCSNDWGGSTIDPKRAVLVGAGPM